MPEISINYYPLSPLPVDTLPELVREIGSRLIHQSPAGRARQQQSPSLQVREVLARGLVHDRVCVLMSAKRERR